MDWKHPIHVAVVRAAGIAINFLLPAIPSPPQQRLSEEILTLYMKGCSLFSVAPFLILHLGMRPSLHLDWIPGLLIMATWDLRREWGSWTAPRSHPVIFPWHLLRWRRNNTSAEAEKEEEEGHVLFSTLLLLLGHPLYSIFHVPSCCGPVLGRLLQERTFGIAAVDISYRHYCSYNKDR